MEVIIKATSTPEQVKCQTDRLLIEVAGQNTDVLIHTRTKYTISTQDSTPQAWRLEGC